MRSGLQVRVRGGSWIEAGTEAGLEVLIHSHVAARMIRERLTSCLDTREWLIVEAGALAVAATMITWLALWTS